MRHSPESTQKLADGYAELESADLALREAEQLLKAAHLRFASRLGPRPDLLYQDVVRLRERSRQLLDEVGELFFVESSRPGP